MLQITPQMKILVAVEPADFRRGIDGLARLCKEALRQDPFVGAVFVFRNRRGSAVKLLTYDGQGFWLCHKRLETPGTFQLPAVAHDTVSVEMTPTQLTLILSGIDLRTARQRKRYQRSACEAEKMVGAPL